jgi:alanyl-tRNA synthetase
LVLRAAEELSCSPEDVVSAASRALAERDANFKSARGIQQRLAETEARVALQSTTAGRNGFRVVSRVCEGVPADYLGFFASEISKAEKTMALLAAAEGGHLVFAQHPSAGRDMSAVLKQVLENVGGKGGGTRDFARGKLAEQGHAQRALDAALALL